MKKSLLLAALLLVVLMVLSVAPVFAWNGHGHGYGHDHDYDCGDGECARDYLEIAPTKGKAAEIPVAHFIILAKYMNDLLSAPASTTSYWNLIAAPLFDGMDDPALNDEVSDFFVVDLRTPTEFCTGHLPMAMNIPVTELGKPENLALLPFDKPILLICNSGHNASVSEGVLRILGYDAWALRGGMLSVRAMTQFPLASPTIKVPVSGVTNTGMYGPNSASMVGCQ
jgi:rhodanese-related sulfurtransferase